MFNKFKPKNIQSFDHLTYKLSYGNWPKTTELKSVVPSLAVKQSSFIFVIFQKHFKEKHKVDFSGIRTWIIGLQGMPDYHKIANTTTVLSN